MDILGLALDILLIGLLGTAISFAVKLTRQLGQMRAGRVEMERFVLAFNATVSRAEAGVQGLKQAARTSGDDLEQLIEKGHSLRDELMFLTESADQIATRLSQTASTATHKTTSEVKTKAPQVKARPAGAAKKKPIADVSSISPKKKQQAFTPSSAAEKELLRVLKKMG